MRRNRLSDFKNVRASGLIAMKLDERDSLIGVATCREGDDVLLATRLGKAIRFEANWRRCGCSPGAIWMACAASGWPRATP